MTVVTEKPVSPGLPKKKAGRGWLATAPAFTAIALFFGLPVFAIVFGAFTAKDPKTKDISFTTANMTESFQDAYLSSLLTSIRLSAVVAVLGVVFGTFLAQAVVTSKSKWMRDSVLSASGVLANFGGVPLAFAWIATLGNSGVVTDLFDLTDHGWSLYSFEGLAMVYLFFSLPLMVLVIIPSLDGLRPQWREAAQNNGASTWQFWRHVGIPVLTPSLLGGGVLLFGMAFAAHATAAAMVGTSVPLITLKIGAALGGDVQIGKENIALAMSLDMILIVAVVMAVYLPLQRRSGRWLA